jgi:6-carboxyhexanoate--CoA ligase
MRGAAVLDARTGERLDPNPSRGVRASRFDYATEIRDAVREALTAAGLGHFRTYEALAVATKVIWSGVTAELCWSDEPAYVAGYVATARAGYVRFPNFKPTDATGGRIFFVQDPTQAEQLIHRLQHECLLIASLPSISSAPLSDRRPSLLW